MVFLLQHFKSCFALISSNIRRLRMYYCVIISFCQIVFSFVIIICSSITKRVCITGILFERGVPIFFRKFSIIKFKMGSGTHPISEGNPLFIFFKKVNGLVETV